VKPVPAINRPKCADCSSLVCFPWRRDELPDVELFVWLCGPCHYLRDRPDASRTRKESKPRKPQSEMLF
jgi:hypothetical protein